MDTLGTVDGEKVNRRGRENHENSIEYRTRLAAVATPADATAGQREVAGRIEPKPEAPKPAAPSDQLRLSKAEPAKPGAQGSRAAPEDATAPRDRAVAEAPSRQPELAKNRS